MTTLTSVKLQACDMGEHDFIQVPREVAIQSDTIKYMIEDLGDNCLEMVIPLHNVTEEILLKIIEYCTYHSVERDEDELNAWDQTYMDSLNQTMLFEIILASNYLDVKALLDLMCQKVASMMQGKTPEEIRVMFNIKNDFTPEEEARIQRENEWIEDKQ